MSLRTAAVLSGFFQQPEGWQFDARSALIGALIAWILAGLIVSQRAHIKRMAVAIWAPIAAWRRRLRASQEETYIRSLKTRLRQRLFLAPERPEAVFIAPAFLAPAPLPTTIAEVATAPRSRMVPYAALLHGHRKVLITGAPGSGRTTSLVVSAWRVAETGDDRRPYLRLPLWIDLADAGQLSAQDDGPAAERLAELAALSLPGLLPKWFVKQMRREPCLVLVDNWETLMPDQRDRVAAWIEAADAQCPDLFWVVAGGPTGYGGLVEKGFVPVELLPPGDSLDPGGLYSAWAELLGQEMPEEDERLAEVLGSLQDAVKAGAPLWELHLRSVLQLVSGELSDRPVDICERFVIHAIEAVELGRVEDAIVEQARDITVRILIDVAEIERSESRTVPDGEVRELIDRHLPSESGRPRRLGGAVLKQLTTSGLLRRDRRHWYFTHAIWRDYFAACALAASESGAETVQAHLEDPGWRRLSEFFAGLADATMPVEALISRAETYAAPAVLLRAARWGVVADPEQPWCTAVAKALARTLLQPSLDAETRLDLARALSLLVAEDARAFFLRAVRHPSVAVQRAALRGLGWAGASQDMPVLVAALQEAQPELQESGVRALRDLGTSGAIRHLSESLSEVNEALMLLIAQALTTTSQGWEALDAATQHPDLLVRRAAAHALGAVGQDWAQALLVEMAREDPEWLVRSAAEGALQAQEEREQQQVHILPQPQVDALEWLMAWAARQGLGLGVGEAARETLIRAAQEGNVDAKVLSALTLAQIGREADASLLRSLVGDADPAVGEAMAWAVELIERRYAVAG